MRALSIDSARSFARVLAKWSRARRERAIATIAVALLAGPLCAAGVRAQTWSNPEGQPLLWQITSVDPTGEAGWPYGSEDIAGDGRGTFLADEAGTDIRTVYADADTQRTWIRAYVTSETAPPEEVVGLFFLDADDQAGTGGPAFGHASWPAWSTDPSRGGYERALEISADGSVLGVFGWSAEAEAWEALSGRESALRAQAGVDEDPIRIGAVRRGYLQVDLLHTLSGLTASCGGNLFVRLFHADPATRSFGDDDQELVACRPALDRFGDPDVLRSVACQVDADCPNGGRCRDGICLFAYACSGNADCRAGEACTDNACVRVVDGSCSEDADCDGLVCGGERCVACAESGDSACPAGLWCAPDGRCVDPEHGAPGSGNGAPDAGADTPKVQGGAFQCTALTSRPTNFSALGLALLALPYFGLRRRRKRSASKPGRRA